MKKNRTVEVKEDLIQAEAEIMLGRELTPSEYEEVCDGIDSDLSRVVQYEIEEVICLNELIENNKDAEKKFPHFKVFHKNENAFQSVFKVVITLGTEEEAKHFIDHNIVTEFDEWRVICVEKDNIEKCVYTLNC